jgi:transaldolase
MIKVPATDAGVKALTTLTAEGVNVNMTLIFSVERYEQVLSAFLKGIEARMAAGESVQSVASVASFFVSRLDSLVSAKLKALGKDEALVEGRIAVANCRLAYDSFLQVKQQRSVDLEKGVQIQKPLWASTSTKSPRLKPTYYVEQLIADQTVNTMPPQTLLACSAGLEAGSLLSMSVEEARQCVAELEAQGVSLSAVCEELVVDGIQKFIDSYRSLLKSIETKCEQLISGQS